MKYVARHYVKIAGRTYTPGEIFDGKKVPDEDAMERLLRLGAVQELKPLVLEEDADGEGGQNDDPPAPADDAKREGEAEDQEPQDEPDGEGEKADDDDEAADDEENEAFREIDVEGVVQEPAPKPAEKPARKPARTAGRKKA